MENFKKAPIRICISGAAGKIAYHLARSIADGSMLGKDQPVALSLLERQHNLAKVGGVVMELEDCCYPLLSDTFVTSNDIEAFKDADIVILAASVARRPGLPRSHLLVENSKIFKGHGQALEEVAKRTAKILVISNPANTNAFVCRQFAPSIPSENFSALTRIDQNRCVWQVAKKLKVPTDAVFNTIVWGNHSLNQMPDIRHAIVNSTSKRNAKVADEVRDQLFVKREIVELVRDRGGAIIQARNETSTISAAKAAVDQIHDWFFGTPTGKFVTMAVVSDGSYGVPEGLVFSFPVSIVNGTAKIVNDLKLDDDVKMAIYESVKELNSERDNAAIHTN